MCGIAGLFRLTGRPTTEDAAAVLRMMDGQIHRGPDDWGLLVPESLGMEPGFRALIGNRTGDAGHLRVYDDRWAGPGAVLGNRRLAILDPASRARMPMSTPDGRFWITHNGEAYNYLDMRRELVAGGASFQSDADTEAIVAGWRSWGEAVLPRIRGMFAFAVFEAGSVPRLVLARDRFGIKPLYYHRDRERVVFASEVRALLASGLVAEETDLGALARFLELGTVPQPRTTVKNVLAVSAGHSVSIDTHGVSSRAYWTLPAHATAADGPPAFAPAAAATRRLLEESARLHLASDVPLGVFLSGGIDSSGLVALASRARSEPLVTLSVGFDETDQSETRFARLVAARHATDHREVVLGPRDLLDNIPGIFAAMDQPTIDGVNTYFIARAARAAGLTVVLSGIGADELFLGYDHLKKAPALDTPRSLFGRLPRWARRASVAAARHAARVSSTRPDKLDYLEAPSADNAYLVFRGLFTPRQIRGLLGTEDREIDGGHEPWPASRPERAESLLDRFVALEFGHYLQNQLLRDADVMAMAHSVEVRVPYLDHPLVEYVVGLPASLKLSRHLSKPLLVAALGDDLPRDIGQRRKMGFTLPFERWMRARAGDLADLSLEQTPLRPAAVRAVWDGFLAGRRHWSRPWALLVLAQLEGHTMRGCSTAMPVPRAT